MPQITGVGGFFIRAKDPAALYAWYEKNLGIAATAGCFSFDAANEKASIAVAFFPRDSTYFPREQPAMLNFQVDDIHALLDRLQAAGVAVDPKREKYDYGTFGWFTDPEGNRVELWQPDEPAPSQRGED
jgi:predicted enzyme related to lactoylglutathione lyase